MFSRIWPRPPSSRRPRTRSSSAHPGVGKTQFAIGLGRKAAHAGYPSVANHYEQGSILVTSNMPFGRMGIFSRDIVAATIDRLVHHAEVLTLAGDSYRTRTHRELLNNPVDGDNN